MGKGMERAWRVSGVLALCVLVPYVRAEVETELLSLDRALEIAFEQGNRPLQIAQLEVSKAAERLAAGRTRRYPVLKSEVQGTQLLNSVEFSFESGLFGDFPGTGPIPAEDTQVTSSRDLQWFVTASVAQPLSQQYQIGLAVKSAELEVDVQQERLRLERQTLARSVREAYHAVLQAQSARAAADQAVSFLEELERVVAGHVEREAALPVDLLDVRARLADGRYHARVSAHAEESAKEQLNFLLGRDVAAPFRVEPLPTPGPLETDLDAAWARAREQRPDLREARLLSRQAELERRRARAEYLPDVSLVASNYSFNIEFLPRNVQTIGLALSWEPFDWGRRRHEIAERALTLRQSEHSAADAEAAARVEVGALYRVLDESRALVDVYEARREAAAERARVLAERHRQEAALLKDVLQAQSDLAQAEDLWRQAVLACWTARARFIKGLGEE
ncbi:MAG TPA: TolC family protein [Candidatus Polarisedimenticolaceae bacterium]|nr:TolC family protein [Candidatus Polarisedimenticolaceae bacterium]